jgi:16S rRNA (uracil1498-N3)-methyltransferase
MQLPFFFASDLANTGESLTLIEETSKHIVGVLRMQEGEQVHLTDGKGKLATAAISEAKKKHCSVSILSLEHQPAPANHVTIAISLVKNTSRFEWFLEKATEIGISSVIPILCHRTERQHFRKDRMEAVLISAMLQSRQCWLPLLTEPIRFEQYTTTRSSNTHLYIAHCDDQHKIALTETLKDASTGNTEICIGPEGDFSPEEINQALSAGFNPVSLGETRLRTETAGLVAATLLRIR